MPAVQHAERHAQAVARLGATIATRYELLDVLGVGGMGVVFLARHRFTDERVALKVIHPDLATNGDVARRFAREAQAPASIHHPGIVRVFDASVDESSGEMYLAMELLQGNDLATSLERGAMELRDLVAVTLQVLDALVAAHARGFVHRDIKPENVFLTPRAEGGWKATLLDFGIARRLDPALNGMTSPGLVVGTLWYMSPEQARGSAVDHRADLWSVGAMLFHALAGRLPFDGDNQNQVLFAIGTEQAPSVTTFRDDLPEGLSALVDRALQHDLDARFQTAEEMVDALTHVFEALGGDHTQLRVVRRRDQSTLPWFETDAPAERPRRRAPWLALAAAALCFPAIGAFAGVASRPAVPAPLVASEPVLRSTAAADAQVLRAAAAALVAPTAPSAEAPPRAPVTSAPPPSPRLARTAPRRVPVGPVPARGTVTSPAATRAPVIARPLRGGIRSAGFDAQ
jgi:tRNA A-37 threonylcarbamoyl transferase component Bud32